MSNRLLCGTAIIIIITPRGLDAGSIGILKLQEWVPLTRLHVRRTLLPRIAPAYDSSTRNKVRDRNAI